MTTLSGIHRRAFLGRCGLGIGAAALTSLLHAEERKPHHEARAKQVIYLHMIGAPSQLDLFDPKPALRKRDGQACPQEFLRGKRFAFLAGQMTLAGSPYRFARYGQSGQDVSELMPHFSKVVDDVCMIRSMHTDEINHAPAQMLLHSGFGRGGRPALGSWLVYGLGASSQNLPAYVVLQSGPLNGAGTALWSSGFLPGIHQGVPFRGTGDAVHFLSNPKGHSPADRRRVLDSVRDLNQLQSTENGDPETQTRIEQYEMAFRMQTSVPELMDLSRESPETLKAYGVQPGKPSFAANCLLARRLIERGVRVVELFDADWDHHQELATKLPPKCRQTDQATAALLRDLKRSGLLDHTLIVWGSEFGRTAIRQGVDDIGAPVKPGRDHHKDTFTIWLAGGGIKRGMSFGRTDELGLSVVENPVHVHDLNATILHLMGLDHQKLTYRHQGRDYRLTDVHGRIVSEILT